MAPARTAMLSALIDDSSADEHAQSDIDMMPTPESQTENKVPAKRKQARVKAAPPATSKVSKAKIASRRVSDRIASSAVGVKSKGRKALAERSNAPNDGNETEEVDDFEDDLASAPAKPVRKTKNTKIAKEEDVMASKARTTKASATTGQKKTARAKQLAPAREVPETQPEDMEVDQTELEDVTITEPAPKRALSRQPLPVQLSSRARSSSRQPDLYARHRRAGSASDTERAGEPALRRKLGDVTRKFENLELKYRSLKELSSTDSQSNFDKLKKATDQRARDQDDIIASLKKEIAAQKASSSENRSARSQNASLQADNQRLATENKTLTGSVTQLQNEVKTLQAKLAAARSNVPADSTGANGRTVPGSAVKVRGPAAVKAAEAENERARIMQMKEELYSDLTGLMIHNVKRLEEEDVFDCIQTGRNGTLRFHLSVSHPTAAGAATPGTSYEDEEFAYEPLLDEKNDKQLLEVLPDYLTEEIMFPRAAAAKFYAKIMDCMSRRFVDEE